MPTSARLLVDLLYQPSGSRHLNFDPETPIRVGDYGHMDGHTGQFILEGNIYSNFDGFNDVNGNTLPVPSESSGSSETCVVSTNMKEVAFGTPTDEDMAKVIECPLKHRFDISKGTGAVLYIIHSTISRMPDEARIRLGNIPDFYKNFARKHIVTEVTNCSGYAMILTMAESDNVAVGLKEGVPLKDIPSNDTPSRWTTAGHMDHIKVGEDRLGKTYSVLYRTLKVAKRPRWWRWWANSE
ncbi:hypothetical protein JAAARDRAFT_41845 [Jaapia argillacea MUCL 33604]|uniref:Uncharacterized protein n=1 Tax=Jaapia argillacea MUCL 33604 TaxID=933084 RepID=A0A067PA92_9AGAM|nr:hypothetical protein JAAARDRAFT_41845 [Jaapia argillacea MUCL 33604]